LTRAKAFVAALVTATYRYVPTPLTIIGSVIVAILDGRVVRPVARRVVRSPVSPVTKPDEKR